jgi:diaminopimelate decarboxylase
MTALVEGHGGEAGGENHAREVVVALLAGPGAVEDDDAPAGLSRWEPQAVRETVAAPDFHGERDGHGPQTTHAPIMPCRRPRGMIDGLVVLTSSQLSQVYPMGARVSERGRLEIGGCDMVEVAREFGTPAYVVAEDDLRARARSFVEAVAARHADFDVLFASKAFPCTAVYRVLAEEGLSCDVASGGELALALRGGFDPARIYLHGNAKSEAELGEALAAGVGHIVLDSLDDVDRLERVAAAHGTRQEVLVRVTPGVAGATHAAISTGQADSKFGFALDQAPDAVARVSASPHLELVGLHFHIGSQLLELEPFRAAVHAISGLGDFPVYNLGGGLGAPYTAEQHPPAIAEYVEAVVGTAREVLGADKRLLIEPGRALVANSTVTLYTVQTVKRNVSTWVAVDGGMSDNLRPMLYASVYEALIADRATSSPTDRFHVAGKHCESGDVIVRDVPLPDPRPGDVLVTPATGAYGHALANNYNGVPRPPVIFCRGGSARVVVRRETYEDLIRRDVGP